MTQGWIQLEEDTLRESEQLARRHTRPPPTQVQQQHPSLLIRRPAPGVATAPHPPSLASDQLQLLIPRALVVVGGQQQ